MTEQLQSSFEGFYRFLASHGYDHPIHPTQVNMPIGLATGALIFLIAAILFRRSGLRYTARHCMILAFLFLFPTALAGIMDWQIYYSGAWLFAIKVKIGLAIALFIVLIWGIWVSRIAERPAAGFFLSAFLAFCIVVALGYFGGNIVFTGRAPESNQDHQKGQLVFETRCSGCHPYGGNMLMPDRSVIHSSRLGTPELLTSWIRTPIPPMPPFPPDKIPAEEARALYDYLSEIWGVPAQVQQQQPAPAPTSPPPAAPATPSTTPQAPAEQP